MGQETLPAWLVVIGASAGGIDALSRLVATLPPSFPAPIVIAQHLDPTRLSHLGEILQRASPLPVHTVVDHTPLTAGTIYVVPANYHVMLTDHDLHLSANWQGRSKPSIDLLLSSAAAVYGEHLIAVILTGTSVDGAAGARRVKEAGGTVLIQNLETAQYPGMPQAVAPNTVDLVTDLETIGPLLEELVTETAGMVPANDQRLHQLLEQLQARTGLDFHHYKAPTIQRRLLRRMAATDQFTLEEYLRYLQQHPSEYQQLAASFLIKVTEFFRDPELFAALQQRILPELIAQAREHSQELRLWSAGCATGEEAYSLAILVAELLREEREQWTVYIFATDIDAQAIAFARRGSYPAAALTSVPPDLVRRYFVPHEGGTSEVSKAIRNLVVFGEHDLGNRAPFPRIDLVLCRNVLIYFTPELQRRALQLFAFALRPGGRLVLGPSETTSPLPEYFVLEDGRLKIYRRQGESLVMPGPLFTPKPAGTPAPPRSPVAGLGLPRVSHAPTNRPTPEPAEQLLQELSVGLVVVDHRYDIQAINFAARRLLEIHTAALGEDIIHLAHRLPSERLRSALNRALQGQVAIEQFTMPSLEGPQAERHQLEIQCSPHRTGGVTEPIRQALLLITDLGVLTADRREQEQRSSQEAQLDQLIAQVRQRASQATQPEVQTVLTASQAALETAQAELAQRRAEQQLQQEARQELLQANQELTAINLELQQQNEELLVQVEEAQAAFEEIETLNEEQQATNEELETLNEELQATIEELNASNEELNARSQELEELARSYRAERARLEAVLASMADAVLVVDRAGQPIVTNQAYEQRFGDIDVVLGDEEGYPLALEETPQRRAARGDVFNMEFTMQAADGSRHWFEACGQPIQNGGEQAGVVVIRDITERSLRQLQETFVAKAGHELRTPLTVLRTALELLQRSLVPGASDERRQRYTSMALLQIRRMSLLVNDLLDLGRIQHGGLPLKREAAELSQVVAQAVEEGQLLGEGPRMVLTTPEELMLVNGDVRRLEQVVLNLLSNAITYASGTERIDVRLRRESGEAELQVQDYGPGIAAEDLEQIFTPFQQGQRSAAPGHGLGLGLAIVKEVVEAHGGQIAVDSQEGVGTIFTIRLPLLEP